MKVCIAEKPSVAKEIAQILGANARKDGYFEGNGYQVTWTFGHFCTLYPPEDYNPKWKRWDIGTLPMLPERFETKVMSNGGVRKQFKIIKNLFARHLTITQERNDYLHGIWHIGWGNEQTADWSVATGYKLDRKKEGTNVKVFSFKVDDFETLTIEANALNQLFRRLSGCFTGPFAVEKNFAFDDDGKVIELKASESD